jgi:hypothetical protein
LPDPSQQRCAGELQRTAIVDHNEVRRPASATELSQRREAGLDEIEDAHLKR